jgi:uncharacterized protein
VRVAAGEAGPSFTTRGTALTAGCDPSRQADAILPVRRRVHADFSTFLRARRRLRLARCLLQMPRTRIPTMPQHARAPFHVLAKPTGAVCNLDCKYCFFLSKEMLYPGSRFRMADELLEIYIRQLLESQPGPEVIVGWQGGEPTLMGLDFFERSIEYVKRFKRPEQQVNYTIQTNGTKLNDEWSAFFKAYKFLVGLSVDGPREMHDAYRVDKGGRGTFDDVMRGGECLNRHGVDVNILCTVNAANADHPLEVYRFFRDELKTEFIQFIPIVERVTSELLAVANLGWGARGSDPRPLYLLEGNQVTARSVSAEQWGRFLNAIFDEWVRRDVGKVYVQMFDAALAAWLGMPSPMCVFNETCGSALALEHNGDVYSCDHFVEPKYLLGNIQQTHMLTLVTSEQQRQFGLAKRDTLPKYCRECAVRFACHGECPKNRFIATPDGEPGLNYLCAGYKAFFTHIDGPMRLMGDLLRQGRYADEAMAVLSAAR